MISKIELLHNKHFYLDQIKRGKVFIYPTDTVLGIGTIISNKKGIDKIVKLKKRDNKPLLVIAPSIEWIKQMCIVSEESLKYIESKLPGPYSFILDLKDKKSIYNKINNGTGTIGVRIPNNWFTEIISENGEAFITTSVNISGEPSATSPIMIDESIKMGVDYIVYEKKDKLSGKSSTIIDMRDGEGKILRK